MSLQAPEKLQKLQQTLHAKAKGSPEFRFYALYDKIYREDVLAHAYRLTCRHGGKPGVDGEDFAAIEAYGVERWLGELAQALREKRYRASPVRRVYIPKANGKQRPLGIPTIRDPDGKVIYRETGTPQGGIVSPVLANVYLHYALDLWFDRVVKKTCRGKATLTRYADDWVCAFEHEDDAERFHRTLPKRLEKFGLEVAPEKTNRLPFSRHYLRKGKRFIFVGFEFYWDKDRKGQPRLKRRAARKRLQAASRRIKAWIKQARHLSKCDFVGGLNRRLTGHYNYYGIIGNGYSINRFYLWVMKCTFKWLNRRGGERKSITEETFWRAVDRGLFRKPRIMVG